jgi:hypothetical protein
MQTDIESGNESCPICFDEEQELHPISCPSNHMFCGECIDKYFKTLYLENKGLLCPICRFEVLAASTEQYIDVRNILIKKLQSSQMTMQMVINVPTGSQSFPITHNGINTNAVHNQYNFERTLLIVMILILLFAFIIAMAVLTYRK